MSANKFITGLGRIFSERLLAPKVLLAPSMRVGQMWLDATARAGCPVLNARAKTLSRLALDLAAPAMLDRGLAYAAGAQLEVLVARAFADLKQKHHDYLTRLDPSAGVVSVLGRSLRDLRLAGVDSSRLPASAFDQPGKAAEISNLLAAYENALAQNNLIDYAGALVLAAAAAPAASGSIFIMPEDQAEGLNRRERDLWAAFPAASRLLVPVDRPDDRGPDENDARLLRFIEQPERAPAPRGDGSARIFRAVGEVNEVREVFRLCLTESIPFDDVEILHTQYDAYVPLIHEAAALLAEPGAELPASFSEGLPARLHRPGRALAALVEWAGGDCPQAVVVRMVQDGLLRLAVNAEGGTSFTRIAAILRAVPIAVGRDRWLPALDHAIAIAEQPGGRRGDRNETGPRERDDRKIAVLIELRRMMADLLQFSTPAASHAQRLRGALSFLEHYARGASEADENARNKLAGSIREMMDCIGDEDIPGFDPLSWLALLPNETRVGGLGPRPGRVLVSPLRGGGHSGRGHTFILGLDDGRFPGGATQDPVLLDQERKGLSPDLSQAAGRAGRAVTDLAFLLARLRGDVTLSYSCRDVVDDRDAYPSQAMLSAGRILSGGKTATLAQFLHHAGPAASFAPDAEAKCLGMPEWWLLRLTGDRVRDAEALVARSFPHLGHGFAARDARDGVQFTEYDGYVPEAGADIFSAASPMIFSASRLERLAQNPLDFFFKYVLKVEPPEEYAYDPSVWLDPLSRGSLLHEVFHRFLTDLAHDGLRPEFERDWPRLQKILAGEVADWELELPAASPAVKERELRELEMAARIFLKEEEEEYCRSSEPLYLEAAIGLKQEQDATAIETETPVAIALPGGQTMLACGLVDRIDRLDGPGPRYAIWDYKTGSAWKYRKEPPFWQGRCIQNALYWLLVQARLDEIEPGAKVAEFGYFFPTGREHGERVSWTGEELTDGPRLLADLCDLAGRGAFPCSDQAGDANFSDCLAAFGDLELCAEEIKTKLAEPDNDALDPFRRLRPAKEKKK